MSGGKEATSESLQGKSLQLSEDLEIISRCSRRMLLRPHSFGLLNLLSLIDSFIHLIIPLTFVEPMSVEF